MADKHGAKFKYNRDGIITQLVEFHRIHGRAPSSRDQIGVSAGSVKRQFGTWNQALLAAGLTPNEPPNRTGHTRADIVALIQAFHSQHGHAPSKAEAPQMGLSSTRVQVLFGAWNEAILAAGLTPNPYTMGSPLTVQTTCDQCGASIQKSHAEFTNNKHHFCNSSCAAKYYNAHKMTGYRRSKLEVWLEGELAARYPGLEIHFNRTDAINAELDIYVPSLKLAFELNGIFHYEPVYGPDTLQRIQSNDQRKFAACAEAGISLCVIDTSGLKYFKPANATKYLKIVTDLVDAVLSR